MFPINLKKGLAVFNQGKCAYIPKFNPFLSDSASQIEWKIFVVRPCVSFQTLPGGFFTHRLGLGWMLLYRLLHLLAI